MDFLVEEEWNVWFLEANSYPDFKQTGQELSTVISTLFDQMVETIDRYFFPTGDNEISKKKLFLDRQPTEIGGYLWPCYSKLDSDWIPFHDHEGR